MSHSQPRKSKSGTKKGISQEKGARSKVKGRTGKQEVSLALQIEKFMVSQEDESKHLSSSSSEPPAEHEVTAETTLACQGKESRQETQKSSDSSEHEHEAKTEQLRTSAGTPDSDSGELKPTKLKRGHSHTGTAQKEAGKKGNSSKPPSSAGVEKGSSRRRKKAASKVASAQESDEEYTPGTRPREIQMSIKDIFPVRRSNRKSKSVLEKEDFEEIADRLRNKDEEGLDEIHIEGKGRGVIATRPFKKGELICEYSGELISYEEAKRREEQYAKDKSIGCYMYYFAYKTKKMCVDATKDNGRFGRLLNHSKTTANVVTKLLEVDAKPYLCLLAARDIQPFEELEYDYGERSKDVLVSHPWLAV